MIFYFVYHLCSFNSVNASMKMKQTLRNNNKALAQALQITKQDLAWATDMIANLQKENKNLMMEKAVSNHVISQSIDGQVNEKLKVVLLFFLFLDSFYVFLYVFT